jgi:hypothetical protein
MLEVAPNAALTAFDSAVVLQGWQAGSVSAVVDQLSRPELWIGAAAGGAFGAALGALPAFIFTGFLVMTGGLSAAPCGQEAIGGVGIGFGPVFGPHISFAAGAAAAAYAADKGILESGFDYHNGKDITFALGSRPDVLAVGAAFGLFGIASEQIFRNLAIPTDPIAITVVLSAFLHRVVFGYSVVGVVTSKADGYFDMGPFEREETRPEGEVSGDNGMDGSDRLAVEPWLPNMYLWSHVAAIGLVVGTAAGYAALQSGSPFLGFGISAASLIFLNLGIEKIPVTHHMTLPGGTAFVAASSGGDALIAGLGSGGALVVAGVFGLIGALLGEVLQRIFYAHGSTHVDPPAFSIFIVHSFIALLTFAGVFSTAVWVPGAAF